MARVVRLVVVALAAVFAVGGCGGESGSGAGGAGGLSTLVEVKPAERKPAPPLAADLLDGGGRFDPSTVHGQVLVVNFWASWCSPCRAEAADLETVYQATKAKGVAFLGINISDGRDKALAFERGRTTYPSIFDPAGRVALGFKDVPPSTIPATLVIDREGRVAVAIRTAVTKANLQPIVERVAAEDSDG
jgi:thiol-disulfide isomerase/thioredoxin